MEVSTPFGAPSDAVLRAMRRSYRSEKYLGILDRVRAAMPDAAITTDIIVGFPGETDADFEQTLDVVREARFAMVATLCAAYGRGIAEVGVSMMLGGNIKGFTRTMTTAMALEYDKGEFTLSLGLGVVLFDYRGYGQSQGALQRESQLLDDAQAVYARIAQSGHPILLYGESLGGGVAAALCFSDGGDGFLDAIGDAVPGRRCAVVAKERR